MIDFIVEARELHIKDPEIKQKLRDSNEYELDRYLEEYKAERHYSSTKNEFVQLKKHFNLADKPDCGQDMNESVVNENLSQEKHNKILTEIEQKINE